MKRVFVIMTHSWQGNQLIGISCQKFKVQTYAGKVLASFFWDIERILSLELLERASIINSEQYLQTLK
jgi:hypothetical protein